MARQRDRDLMLRDGDALFATRGATGFTLTRRAPGRFIGIRVPREAVALLLGRLDETPISLVPHRTEALNLLATYAGAIAEALPLATPELQRLTVSHMHDLIAATIRATRDGRAIAEGRGIAAARLRAIMTDISAHLGDGDLSVAEITRRHRVTRPILRAAKTKPQPPTTRWSASMTMGRTKPNCSRLSPSLRT